MLSRVAERIYWLGRYVERAENTARLVNVNTHLLLDLPRKVTLGWQPLIEITGSTEPFEQAHNEASERTVVRFLIADENNPGSLLSSLKWARENARTIRDIIPREGWEKVNDLYLSAKAQLTGGLARSRRYENLVAVISASQQLTGLLAGTMLHDSGYEFLRMGRNLERADMTTRIIDVRTANLLPEESAELVAFQNVQWMSLLQSLSAYQAYRQRMQAPVRRVDVLAFLLRERQFPRAFLHCMGEVHTSIANLPRNAAPLAALDSLCALLDTAQAEHLENHELHQFIDRLQLELGHLHTVIWETYFLLEQRGPELSQGQVQ